MYQGVLYQRVRSYFAKSHTKDKKIKQNNGVSNRSNEKWVGSVWSPSQSDKIPSTLHEINLFVDIIVCYINKYG